MYQGEQYLERDQADDDDLESVRITDLDLRARARKVPAVLIPPREYTKGMSCYSPVPHLRRERLEQAVDNVEPVVQDGDAVLYVEIGRDAGVDGFEGFSFPEEGGGVQYVGVPVSEHGAKSARRRMWLRMWLQMWLRMWLRMWVGGAKSARRHESASPRH